MKKLIILLLACTFYNVQAAQNKMTVEASHFLGQVQSCSDAHFTAQWVDKQTKQIMQTRTLDLSAINQITQVAYLRVIKSNHKPIQMQFKYNHIAAGIGELQAQYTANTITHEQFWNNCAVVYGVPPQEYHDEVKDCEFVGC